MEDTFVKEISKKYGVELHKIKEGIYTDGYFFLVDKNIAPSVDEFLNLLQMLYQIKELGGGLDNFNSSNVFLKNLMSKVLADTANDFQILENTDSYVVYTAVIEMPNFMK